MLFITNGYKRFSKTNSSDPRQRVPLIGLDECENAARIIAREDYVTDTSDPAWVKGDCAKCPRCVTIYTFWRVS